MTSSRTSTLRPSCERLKAEALQGGSTSAIIPRILAVKKLQRADALLRSFENADELSSVQLLIPAYRF